MRPFTERHIVLCEGPHDVHFLQSLIATRNLPSFQLACPKDLYDNPIEGEGGGRDKFTEYLNGAVATTGFDKVEAILIVSDNDADPARSFTCIQELIGSADPIDGFVTPPKKFQAPTSPLTATVGVPKIAVMMLPWTNIPGALETLCLQAAVRASPKIAACVDEFAKCSDIKAWSQSKQDKMRLRSLIASQNNKNPDLSLAWLWNKNSGLIPLTDPVFDQIANFLRDFDTFLAAP